MPETNHCPHCDYKHPVATMVADHIRKEHRGSDD